MFRKNDSNNLLKASTSRSKETSPSVITKELNILGNIISDGNIDFDGTLNGNIRCATLTIRANGCIKGEVMANTVIVYGIVKGLIRAKNVQLFAHCNVEGIIMHETVTIEDGAIVDGKFKRTDKIQQPTESDSEDTDYLFDDGESSDSKILDNIRLIR